MSQKNNQNGQKKNNKKNGLPQLKKNLILKKKWLNMSPKITKMGKMQKNVALLKWFKITKIKRPQNV